MPLLILNERGVIERSPYPKCAGINRSSHRFIRDHHGSIIRYGLTFSFVRVNVEGPARLAPSPRPLISSRRRASAFGEGISRDHLCGGGIIFFLPSPPALISRVITCDISPTAVVIIGDAPKKGHDHLLVTGAYGADQLLAYHLAECR